MWLLKSFTPEYRGKGVDRKLDEKAIEVAREHGLKSNLCAATRSNYFWRNPHARDTLVEELRCLKESEWEKPFREARGTELKT